MVRRPAAFSIDDATLQPAYYGQISQFAPIFNLSLTVSHIPDEGATSISFDPEGSSVFFGLDSGGGVRIIPGASVTLPGGSFYQLTANTNFFVPPFTPDYHGVLDFVYYSRVQKDDITWAPAVRAVPGLLPGDYNRDNTADAADYVVWRKGLGTTYTQADYDVWRSHFGQTTGSGSGVTMSAAVPEPVSLIMLLVGMLAIISSGRSIVS
jgi:hypothetical protein